jgi:hypothetical protein
MSSGGKTQWVWMCGDMVSPSNIFPDSSVCTFRVHGTPIKGVLSHTPGRAPRITSPILDRNMFALTVYSLIAKVGGCVC